MSRRLVVAVSTLAVGLMAVQYPLEGDAASWMSHVSWLLAAGCAVAGTRVAARGVEDPRRRSAWRLLYLATIVWLAGQVLWSGSFAFDVEVAEPVAELLWLAFAPIAYVGVARLAASGEGFRRFELPEALAVGTGVTGIAIALLWHDFGATELSTLGAAIAVAYAVMYLGLAAVLAQIVPRDSGLTRHRDLLLLLAGFVGQAVAFTWWAPKLLAGDYVAGASTIDMVWTIGLVLIAHGGLAAPTGAPVVPRTMRDHRRAGRLPSALLFTVLGAAVYALVIDDEPGVIVVLLAAAGVMALLLEVRAARFADQLIVAEEELTSFLELAPVMLAIGQGGHFQKVNAAFEATLGYTEGDLLGSAFLDLVHPDDIGEAQRVLQAMGRSGEPAAIENRVRHKDGGYRWLSWTAVAAPDHHQRYIAARDVTELKELHHDLERSNADLERFAYAASHDLAEPLRTIASFSQLVERENGPRLDERGRRHLAHVIEAADRMRTLIDAMLGYSRAGRRRLTTEPVDLGEVVDGTVELLGAQIAETGAHVTHDPLPVVTGDAQQLGQLLQNLISNAVKFSGEQEPRVHVAGTRENGGWHVTVADNGIGVEERHRARIFDMFERLHSRGDYPGTGIGLSLCAKIVERHGGRIWVDSATGHGSTFHFTIHEQKGAGSRA